MKLGLPSSTFVANLFSFFICNRVAFVLKTTAIALLYHLLAPATSNPEEWFLVMA